MPVTISINGTNAAEALEELSALAAGFGGAMVPLKEPVPGRIVEPESKPAKRTDAKKAEPKPEESAPETAVETEADTSDKTAEDIPAIEDIRAKAQTVKDKAAVKALLEEFGAKNLTALAEDQRAEFMARLEEL